jgi:LmbE family N-acetylglucosaminyl deacetylase
VISLSVGNEGTQLRRVLCVGAHSDDIEIGCGGTLLQLLEHCPDLDVRWIVLSGDERRAQEARCAASLFLTRAGNADVVVKGFRDGFFPYVGADIKSFFEELKRDYSPDLIFTHRRVDLHQDHRLVSELTWNTFRDHMILEYEIPKYDGDLTTPNVYIPLDDATRRKKVALLMQAFASQRDKRWFTPDTFEGLLRLRGIECASPTGYAEAFHAHKVVLDWSGAATHQLAVQ